MKLANVFVNLDIQGTSVTAAKQIIITHMILLKTNQKRIQHVNFVVVMLMDPLGQIAKMVMDNAPVKMIK